MLHQQRGIVFGMRSSRPYCGRRGQAVVETALLFPLLMLLILGSADLGRLFYYSVEITNAAREGARQGVYYDLSTANNPNDSYAAVLAAVKQEAADLSLSLSSPTISPSHCPGGSPPYPPVDYPSVANSGWVYICFDGTDSTSGPAAQTIRVTILYNATPITPMLSTFIGSSSVPMEASTIMVVQGRP